MRPVERREVCEKSKKGQNRNLSSYKVFAKERHNIQENP